MKTIKLSVITWIACCLVFTACKRKCEPVPSQPQWTQKANFPSARSGAISFVVGGKAYLGTGYDGYTYLNDLWEYSPATDAWTQKADFGGSGRTYAAAFVINGKAYVGTGFNGTYLTDLWEYDPTSDSWSQKTDFGGSARAYAFGFSISGKGYIGTGALVTSPVSGSGTVYQDVWEYNPGADHWQKKADFPSAKFGTFNFVIGSKAYVGAGLDVRNNGEGLQKDVWEYNPNNDGWTRKANFSGKARAYAFAFAIDNTGYVGTGGTAYGLTKDLWAYDPVHDSWKQRIDFGGEARDYSTGFSLNGKGYAGTGYNGIDTRLGDLWEFRP
jgi:N-acetylneuraminic acid mutarotase